MTPEEPALWVASLGEASPSTAHRPGLTRWRGVRGGGPTEIHLPMTRPSFLARHPSRPMLYATHLEADGAVVVVRTDGAAPSVLSRHPSGGSFPCHLTVHPDGGWLYAANYGDGTVSAMALDAQGAPTGETVRLEFAGSSAHPDRQTASHPHATSVSPGGGFLVSTDLGADVLRAYRLEDGRPVGDVVLTSLPAGSGPRHVAWCDRMLVVACELDGTVAVVAWDESTGRGELVGGAPATTRGPDNEVYLSDILVHADLVVVAARGSDTLGVLNLDATGALDLVAEVPTSAWPNHLALVDDQVLVAATHADGVFVHKLGGPQPLGRGRALVPVAAPTCLLVEA